MAADRPLVVDHDRVHPPPPQASDDTQPLVVTADDDRAGKSGFGTWRYVTQCRGSVHLTASRLAGIEISCHELVPDYVGRGVSADYGRRSTAIDSCGNLRWRV